MFKLSMFETKRMGKNGLIHEDCDSIALYMGKDDSDLGIVSIV